MPPDSPSAQPLQPLPDQLPELGSSHQRTGKIARLPKSIRDRLNFMLLDGVPYAQILSTLGESAKGINENNLTRWSQGGYQDFLKVLLSLAETRVKQEVAMDLACPEGGSRIHEATLQLAAAGLADMLRQFDFSAFGEQLQADPTKLIPFLNSLATISRAELSCERHRFDTEERRARLDTSLVSQKEPGLTTKTRQVLEKDLSLM